METNLPTGTVTFLFTDIEDSTRLWERYPEAMHGLLAEHDAILREAIKNNNGQVIKGRGDGVHAVFAAAADAVNTTIDAQRQFVRLENAACETGEGSSGTKSDTVTLRVRMGLHTGEAEIRAGDYFGQAPNRAARVMSVGHGGQILMSGVTAGVVRENMPPDTSLLDLGEHHLKGLLRPDRIHQVVASGVHQTFPPLSSAPAATNNLPVQLTSFIGRQQELVEAQDKLAGAHLLTLIGPGGIGKTRLSLQIASDQVDNFDAGIWLVELAVVTDPGQVPAAVAFVLGLREAPGIPLTQLIADTLHNRRVLLVLDNCEHLVEACAQLAERLLQSCSRLKIIASSREALGIGGEVVYHLPPLSAAGEDLRFEPTQEPGRGDWKDYEAVQLFLDRAAAANSRFSVSDSDAPAILQIVRRLDGIPLAIELAAARVKIFTPAQIADRLDSSFKLLTGGSRTAMPRQQTLRALIDWSYQLLDESEQRTFRCLAVFSNGWTFEAAEAVIGEIEAWDFLPGLVGKSLVIVEVEADQSRYRFLETIRQFAMDRLVESGELEETRDRHLNYMLDLTARADKSIFANIDPQTLNETEVEHDNLRLALDWATANHPEKALRLATNVGGFWMYREYNSEAQSWCRAILDRTEGLPGSDAERAGLYALLSWMFFLNGSHHESLAAVTEAFALRTGDSRVVGFTYFVQAMASLYLGDFPAARQAVVQGEKTAREKGDTFGLAFILWVRGRIMLNVDNDVQNARLDMEESARLAEETGSHIALTLTKYGLALVSVEMDDLEAARRNFRESTDVAMAFGNLRLLHSNQSTFAHALRQHGEFGEALEIYKDLLPKWNRIGHQAAVLHELECIAYILVRNGDPGRAGVLLGAAEALRKTIGKEMTAVEKEEYAREIAALQATLDKETFRDRWRQGCELSLDEAIAFAITIRIA